ncbi:hypothetical protein MKX03_020576 [Papaver bracteatum]|nr:hypothetical protein MKX03_020576 [Papaver bracteatum]
MKLNEGKALVEECASVKFWDYYSQHRYSKKILELDNYLRRFFQMDVQAAIWCDVVQICWDNNKILGKVTHIIDLLTKERGTSCDSINDGAEEGDQGVYNLEGGTSSSTTRGTLEVLLVDAYKLKDTDFFGKMDPYVIIQFGNQKRKSTVARGEGKAPVWNEKFTFDVEYPDNIRDELNLTIMDKDWFSRDDFVGESTINLTDVLSFGVKNGRSEIRVSSPVLLNKTYSGEIRVGISFTRKDGNADDKASYLGGWKQ